jgi:cellobiose transport system substrate-binding protein
MRVAMIKRPAVVFGVGVLLAGTVLAACGNKTNDSGTPANGPVTLTVNLFGDFGYKDLYDQYRQTHPNVTIKENVTDYNTHHKNLQAHLLASAGTADIEAIEIGQIAGFRPQAAKFVNFLDKGVDKSEWSDAKVQPAISPDGKSLFGVGTDIGGLAMCYRTDLFKQAGMPTDRESVSKLIDSWDNYFSVGQQFIKKVPTAKWFDASSNVFNAILFQAPEGVYDSAGNVSVTTNPAVKQAFDMTVAGINAGESAALAAFTPQWNTGFQKGGFATITCPAWMLAYIKDNAPDTAQKWDVATIPGTHGGNWGGSYLTVPTASKNQAAAVELAKWLTAPEQQSWLFKNKGNFPSAQALWTQPDVANFTSPFFNNAPVGKIFSESAKALKYQPLGAHGGEIGNAIANALVSIEQGKAKPDEAWAKALADIKNLTS